jgi:hypothetical protein
LKNWVLSCEIMNQTNFFPPTDHASISPYFSDAVGTSATHNSPPLTRLKQFLFSSLIMSFDSVPILDLSLADNPSTKPAFLADLRHAIIDVGFLYIKKFGIDQSFLDKVCEYGKDFFALPTEEKLRIEMKNGPHFLGYNKLGNEITARKTDFREQVDIGTELPTPTSQDPRYRFLYGNTSSQEVC